MISLILFSFIFLNTFYLITSIDVYVNKTSDCLLNTSCDGTIINPYSSFGFAMNQIEKTINTSMDSNVIIHLACTQDHILDISEISTYKTFAQSYLNQSYTFFGFNNINISDLSTLNISIIPYCENENNIGYSTIKFYSQLISIIVNANLNMFNIELIGNYSQENYYFNQNINYSVFLVQRSLRNISNYIRLENCYISSFNFFRSEPFLQSSFLGSVDFNSENRTEDILDMIIVLKGLIVQESYFEGGFIQIVNGKMTIENCSFYNIMNLRYKNYFLFHISSKIKADFPRSSEIYIKNSNFLNITNFIDVVYCGNFSVYIDLFDLNFNGRLLNIIKYENIDNIFDFSQRNLFMKVYNINIDLVNSSIYEVLNFKMFNLAFAAFIDVTNVNLIIEENDFGGLIYYGGQYSYYSIGELILNLTNLNIKVLPIFSDEDMTSATIILEYGANLNIKNSKFEGMKSFLMSKERLFLQIEYTVFLNFKSYLNSFFYIKGGILSQVNMIYSQFANILAKSFFTLKENVSINVESNLFMNNSFISSFIDLENYYITSNFIRWKYNQIYYKDNQNYNLIYPIYGNDTSRNLIQGCEQFISNCYSCGFNSICLQCIDGFNLSNNTCIISENNSNTNETNCSIDSNLTNCNNCGFNYSINNFYCYDCDFGYNLMNGSCYINDMEKNCSNEYNLYHCNNCSFDLFNNSYCDQCEYGYYLNISNGRCYISDMEKNCSNEYNLYHCNNCSLDLSNNSYCDQCEYGYYLNISNGRCYINDMEKNCSNEYNLNHCNNCSLDLSNNSYCDQCEYGYYLNISNGRCYECPYNCDSCGMDTNGSDTYCFQCSYGLILSSDSKTCFSCSDTIPKCKKCHQNYFNHTICDICEDGYYFNETCKKQNFATSITNEMIVQIYNFFNKECLSFMNINCSNCSSSENKFVKCNGYPSSDTLFKLILISDNSFLISPLNNLNKNLYLNCQEEEYGFDYEYRYDYDAICSNLSYNKCISNFSEFENPEICKRNYINQTSTWSFKSIDSVFLYEHDKISFLIKNNVFSNLCLSNDYQNYGNVKECNEEDFSFKFGFNIIERSLSPVNNEIFSELIGVSDTISIKWTNPKNISNVVYIVYYFDDHYVDFNTYICGSDRVYSPINFSYYNDANGALIVQTNVTLNFLRNCGVKIYEDDNYLYLLTKVVTYYPDIRLGYSDLYNIKFRKIADFNKYIYIGYNNSGNSQDDSQIIDNKNTTTYLNVSKQLNINFSTLISNQYVKKDISQVLNIAYQSLNSFSLHLLNKVLILSSSNQTYYINGTFNNNISNEITIFFDLSNLPSDYYTLKFSIYFELNKRLLAESTSTPQNFITTYEAPGELFVGNEEEIQKKVGQFNNVKNEDEGISELTIIISITSCFGLIIFVLFAIWIVKKYFVKKGKKTRNESPKLNSYDKDNSVFSVLGNQV